jgi:murein DD-endopeptidase MepM/ murein hydrolase activator NlpD
MSVHTVKPGDTLWEIARNHHMTLQQLLAANPGIENPDLIRAGQHIQIPDHRDDREVPRAPSAGSPGASGIGAEDNVARGATNDTRRTYTVRAGDTMSEIADRFDVSLQRLIAANPQIRNPNLIHVGQEVTIPGGAAAPAPAPSAPAPGPNRGGAHLETFPVGGGRFNIGYDREWNDFDHPEHNSDYYTHPGDANHQRGHHGVDIFAPRGAPVRAPVTGTVVSVDRDAGGAGGMTVTIKRGQHYFYLAHLNSIANIREGQQISAGTQIGTVGNTGAPQSAPHLHFSIYTGSYYNSTNPFLYLMEVAPK